MQVDLRISGRIAACVPQVNRLGIQPVLEISHLAQVAFLQSHEIQCQAAKSNSSSVFTPCLHSLAACDGNAVGVSALGQGGNCRTFESIPDAARNWVRVPQIGSILARVAVLRRAELRQETSARAAAEVMGPAC